MPESSIVSTIIQGGAVGLCALLIWVVYKLVTNHDSHLLDALDRNTDAWKENAVALKGLTDKLDE